MKKPDLVLIVKEFFPRQLHSKSGFIINPSKGVRSSQADREFKNIILYTNLFKPASVKVGRVGYLFNIKIVYLCEMA